MKRKTIISLMLCLLLLFLPACENKAENDVPEIDRSVPVTEAPETTTIKKEAGQGTVPRPVCSAVFLIR